MIIDISRGWTAEDKDSRGKESGAADPRRPAVTSWSIYGLRFPHSAPGGSFFSTTGFSFSSRIASATARSS